MRARRLLLVEDEEGLRTAIERFLRDRGFECRAVADAESAMLLLGSRPPWDLLVSDWHLPGASGLELVARARAERSDLPVLLVSGSTDPDLLVEARRLGACFLAKPFHLASLLEAVLAALDAPSDPAR